MKHRPIVCALAALVFPTAVHAQAAPTPVTLRYKLQTGQVLRYQWTMSMSTLMSGMPGAAAQTQTPQMNMESDMIVAETVQSVRPSDGAATLVAHVENIKLDLNGQPMTNMVDKMSASIEGTTVTLSPIGKVLAVSLPAGASSPIPGMDTANMGAMMLSPLFPEGPVSIGDTWNGAFDFSKLAAAGASPLAALALSTKSTLKSLQPGDAGTIATIQQTITGGTDPDAAQPANNFHMTMDLTGDNTIGFNVDKGVLDSTNASITANVQVVLKPANGQGAAPTKLHVKAITHTSMHLLPDAAAPQAAPAQ